jgi:hypothetical protein
LIHERGKLACGPYPPSVASALLAEAEMRVRAAGHPLRITIEAAHRSGEDHDESEQGDFEYACQVLDWHFAETPEQ